MLTRPHSQERSAKGKSLTWPSPEFMQGMNYFAIPGGDVLDALNENGGSCAQLAPLLAALLYDANYQDNAFIRTYGANVEGLSHDTAIYKDRKGVEYDLQKRPYSDGRGIRILGQMADRGVCEIPWIALRRVQIPLISRNPMIKASATVVMPRAKRLERRRPFFLLANPLGSIFLGGRTISRQRSDIRQECDPEVQPLHG